MTHELVKENDVICMEDLDIKELLQTRLAKEVSDASFGEIRRHLAYKTEWYGKQLVITDRWYPSSQTCSSCGKKDPVTKDLSVRKWTCPHCKTEHDRDINAAINLRNEGMRMITG